jgi:hypothetical protein
VAFIRTDNDLDTKQVVTVDQRYGDIDMTWGKTLLVSALTSFADEMVQVTPVPSCWEGQ